ncbi:MAG: hypothetical protein C0473_01080 [Cyanobacteria bacterium DS3.002]|nr:hypothetical protein [Cyanobacteria bacterium DS3.002]
MKYDRETAMYVATVAVIHEVLGVSNVLSASALPCRWAQGVVEFSQSDTTRFQTSTDLENKLVALLGAVSFERPAHLQRSFERALLLAKEIAELRNGILIQSSESLADILAVVSSAKERAQQLLQANIDHIERVANHIVMEGAISGDALRRMINKV